MHLNYFHLAGGTCALVGTALAPRLFAGVLRLDAWTRVVGILRNRVTLHKYL